MKTDAATTPTKDGAAPKPEEGFAQKYTRILAWIEKHPIAADDPFRSDPMVVLANVNRGLNALRPHLATLRADTSVNWDDVMATDDVAEALVFACDQVVEIKVTREEIDEKRAELQKLREPGLLILRGLALLDEVPLKRVEALEEGKGILDAGRDGIGIAALLREYAEPLAGKHPFNEKRLQKMETLGAWILRHVTPDGAVAVKPSEPSVSALRRDTIWAELRRRHASMRLGGFKVFGEAFNDFVPPLGSRVVSRGSAEVIEDPPVPVPAPAPAPAPAPVADPIRPA